MVHLQARRNLDVFLRKNGILQFSVADNMSFQLPGHRLDLSFGHSLLQITLSAPVKWVSDDIFLHLMAQAGLAGHGPILRVFRLPNELGINAAIPDTDSAESWCRLYLMQKKLIHNILN